ncbi:MAG: hypothetical protein IKS23_05155 [Alphaproteobacteria bacterium]|nr:hypothetical protein [Alphaproteobacteria bacterium]
MLNIFFTLIALLCGVMFPVLGVKLLSVVSWRYPEFTDFMCMFLGLVLIAGGAVCLILTYDGMIEIFSWGLPHVFPWK